MTFDLYLTHEATGLLDLPDPAPGDPIDFHRSLPGYRVTPLLDVPDVASRVGVARVLVKDESERLGLPAFKMLGASWATARAIQREWLPELRELTIDALRTALGSTSGRRLAAATDGNHGRGVARMAKMLGLGATIFVPAGMAAARIGDIESEGAEVIVVDGSYDDAIIRSAQESSDLVLVISDTSWEGYTQTPTDVILGYSTMFTEIDDVLEANGQRNPDVVLLQSGVGAFAAAGLRHFRAPARDHPSRGIIVEPTHADCLLRSARAGVIAEAPGPHDSTMAGLNCGLPSALAWPIVKSAAGAYISIDDEHAHAAMRLLADNGIVAGESGAAGLAALLATLGDEDARAGLGIRPDSVVLVINTEGATDPVNYANRVGVPAATVLAESLERRRSTGVLQVGGIE